MEKVLTTAETLNLAFRLAFSEGDFAKCQSLIQQGAYPDARDEKGDSTLKEIVSSPKRVKFARMLIKAGAAVNGTNALGETALFAAARAGNDKAVKLLLKHRADPNIRNRKGVTALMQATEEGHLDVVKALVDAGADVNAADDNGDTALMISAAMDCKDVVGVLLAAGADRSLSTPYGWNALAFAVAFEHTEISEMLKMDLPEDEWPGPAVAVPALFEGALVAQKEDAAHGFSQGTGAASVG